MTYTAGHKAREITRAEEDIAKLETGAEAAANRREAKISQARALRLKADGLDETAWAAFRKGEWDRKIEAAQDNLAWLRSMPVRDDDEPEPVDA